MSMELDFEGDYQTAEDDAKILPSFLQVVMEGIDTKELLEFIQELEEEFGSVPSIALEFPQVADPR